MSASPKQFLIAGLRAVRQHQTWLLHVARWILEMLSEIKGRDLVRSLILSAGVFGLLSAYFYVRGGFSFATLQTLLAIVILAAVFDIFWLNAKRKRLQSRPGNPTSPAEEKGKQIEFGRKVAIVVGAIVIIAFAVKFLFQLSFLINQ